MKSLKTYIFTLLRETEDCQLVTELLKVKEKTKSKAYLAIIYNKKKPIEKTILLLEPNKEDLEITGYYAITQDFGLKIIGEMSFNIFFKDSSVLYTFEALSIGSMWTVISNLTKACQFPQGIKPEHLWAQVYLKDFNLDSKKTNIVVRKEEKNNEELFPVKEILQKRLKVKEKEYTESKKLNVVIITWNVGQKIPQKSLNELLHLKDVDADIYAIGLQEIDMSATAMLKEETEQGIAWDSLITSVIDSKKYEKISSKQLVGIYNCVFIKKQHLEYVSAIKTDSVSVGVMGYLGNKGGISIRFQLLESSFCFTSAHLTAHKGKVEQRNQNFYDILNGSFASDGLDSHPFRHDFLFWYGDLNYRTELSYEDTLVLIQKKDYKSILDNDQLSIEKKNGKVFNSFKEHPIDFPPTYRFDTGTNQYDTSEKKRVPSYTDRVLYRTNEKDIQCINYTSHQEYNSSDHKPVFTLFHVMVKKRIDDKYQKLKEEISKELTKIENGMRPEISINPNEINFGEIKYNQPIKKTVVIENIGKVPAQYSFSTKPGSDQKVSWLIIDQSTGVITQFEKIEIEITVHVKNDSASSLNLGTETIQQTFIIVHLKNGGDSFISIKGTWVKSCFGNSLTNLIKDKNLKVPREMWKLIDYIYKNGIKTPGIFLENSNSSEIDSIREKLDKGESLSGYNVLAVAEALLLFLQSLTESVIPLDFYEKSIAVSGSKSAALNVVAKFPPVNFNCFNYLMAFLRELLRHQENKLTMDNLALIFSNILFKSTYGSNSIYEKKAKMSFIKIFLSESIEYYNIQGVK